jgi:hypothetical protein
MNVYTPGYFLCLHAQIRTGDGLVAARPENHKVMTRWERLKVAWRVYKGELDALQWENGQ